ncbi:MAG: 5-methylcytosine-specific restriction endonuclease system specificity protein McrC [Pseudomonadota bacterium]
MESIAVEKQSKDISTRLLGKIPVRNIWLLMLYASNLYRQQGSNQVAIDENPDKIADLVAEILCHQVEQRLFRNLTYGYQNKTGELTRIRGRIDALFTESHRLMERGKICCKYDMLTVDTPRNQYIRAALDHISSLVFNKELSCKCCLLAKRLHNIGVSKSFPYGYSTSRERFNCNDAEDNKMVSAAELAFSLALPTEFFGRTLLPIPDKNIEWLRKLFEKGIGGFYSAVLDRSRWNVLTGKQFNWQICSKTNGMDKILPSMKTDIIIDNQDTGNRLIIDTKFNEITTKGWYRTESLRNTYLYQMYTYLRSQENIDDPQSLATSGMLLHPSIDRDYDESVTIQGHLIRFCTVNLGLDAFKIKERLLHLLKQ